ncbi:DUF1566 domain-containing protein [Azospirillum brasilense]|uniref:Lcl C-terminal domain-containing protein n=1 Tax=Azospirillum brasilense TaxID=192 RepID=UPI0013B4203F|nr:DUF1566 domain-containing protein [Azospirillum brasilense]
MKAIGVYLQFCAAILVAGFLVTQTNSAFAANDTALTAAELRTLIIGNSLVRTAETFQFSPNGKFRYTDREEGKSSIGLWEIKKAKVDYKGGRVDDMLCLAVGRSEKKSFQFMPCLRMFPDDEGRKGVYLGVSADCRNTDTDMTECNFADRTFGYYAVQRSSDDARVFDANYVDNKNGTVTDRRTGLQWMQCSLGQQKVGRQQCHTDPTVIVGGLSVAEKVVQDFNRKGGFAGKSDWRLPTIDELKSLVICSNGKPTPLKNDEQCNYPLPAGMSGDFGKPTFDSVFYGRSTSYLTTSKETMEGLGGLWGPGSVWVVDFSTGGGSIAAPFMLADERTAKISPFLVRLVRKAK